MVPYAKVNEPNVDRNGDQLSELPWSASVAVSTALRAARPRLRRRARTLHPPSRRQSGGQGAGTIGVDRSSRYSASLGPRRQQVERREVPAQRGRPKTPEQIRKLARENEWGYFDKALRRKRVKVSKTQFRSPNMNAYVERFVQSIKQECLDHFFIFGTQHLDALCREYLAHYLTERPHQGRDNDLLIKLKPRMKQAREQDLPRLANIRCHSRLGGLLKSYSRKAA
jgi:transposase InsO family protein